MKLYELAYFVSGDILELGSYRGLSTKILAWANDDSPRRKLIYSIDLSPEHVQMTGLNLRKAGRAQHVQAALYRRLANLVR